MSTSDPTRSEQFMELLRQHQSKLYGLLFALLQDMDAADDLYQQSALVAWRKFDDYKGGTNFGAWICRIAQYEVLAYRQKLDRSRVVFSEPLMAMVGSRIAERESASTDDRWAALSACIGKLRDADRELLEATYVQGENAAVISRRTGRPTASIYNALSRIRKALMQCVRKVLSQEAHG